jgi:hypothetical protein
MRSAKEWHDWLESFVTIIPHFYDECILSTGEHTVEEVATRICALFGEGGLREAVLSQYIQTDNGTSEGSQLLDGKWYIPKWGCDTLDHILDAILHTPQCTCVNAYTSSVCPVHGTPSHVETASAVQPSIEFVTGLSDAETERLGVPPAQPSRVEQVARELCRWYVNDPDDLPWDDKSVEWKQELCEEATRICALFEGAGGALSQQEYDALVRDAMKWRANDEEKAWLIERRQDVSGEPPRYWAGGDFLGWTTDINDAIRFARREDALRVHDRHKGPILGYCNVVEHLWIDERHKEYSQKAVENIPDRASPPPADPGLRDSQRLDWLEHVMTYDDNYVEVYLSGLRNQTGKATAFQVEVNPEKIATLNAPTLREAIDAAQGKWESEIAEEHAFFRTPPPWACDDCMMRDMTEAEGNAHHSSTGHSVSSK